MSYNLLIWDFQMGVRGGVDGILDANLTINNAKSALEFGYGYDASYGCALPP